MKSYEVRYVWKKEGGLIRDLDEKFCNSIEEDEQQGWEFVCIMDATKDEYVAYLIRKKLTKKSVSE